MYCYDIVIFGCPRLIGFSVFFSVTHIYKHTYTQLYNTGPSSVSGTVLEVGWPSRYREEHLLYAMEIITDGPIRCHINGSLNPLELEVKDSHIRKLLISSVITDIVCPLHCVSIVHKI